MLSKAWDGSTLPLENREAEPTRTWDERCGIAMLDPETGPLEHLIWVGSSRKQ
jgi:hypothetical protein